MQTNGTDDDDDDNNNDDRKKSVMKKEYRIFPQFPYRPLSAIIAKHSDYIIYFSYKWFVCVCVSVFSLFILE